MEHTLETLQEKQTKRIAIITFLSFVTVIILSEFREQIFKIVPGYAPHNFAFNILFYFPSILIIDVVSLLLIIRTLKYWKKWNLKSRLIILIVTLTVLVFWLFNTVKIISMF